MESRPPKDLSDALGILDRPGGEHFADFTVRCGDRNVNVSCSTNSDWEVTGVSLSCGYDFAARADASGDRGAQPLRAVRPLAITLTPENAADRGAKEDGLVVEWQSHDQAFDDAVYIRTPTTDPAVLAAVLGPAVRRAVLDLFAAGFRQVEIDVADKVRAAIGLHGMRAAAVTSKADQARRALDAFAQLISSLPVVAASGAQHPGRPLRWATRLLGAIGAIGWCLNVGYTLLVDGIVRTAVHRENTDLGAITVFVCLAVGLVGGYLGARWYGSIVARRVRGRSEAHDLIGQADIAAFGGFSVIFYTLALAALIAWGGG